MSDGVPFIHIDYAKWFHTFRDITNATNERTFVTGNVPESGVGNSAPVIDYEHARAIASALVLANLNSIPLDWAARFSVGGVHMNFFILKQLPVLPPESYLESLSGAHATALTFAEVIVPRVLELTYTAHDLDTFAVDIGYDGSPFAWDDLRRHRLRCELDAVYAHMYGLERAEVEWILDAPSPSASFPTLKRNEISRFGEYRTQRFVLSAYDQLAYGENPNLEGELS